MVLCGYLLLKPAGSNSVGKKVIIMWIDNGEYMFNTDKFTAIKSYKQGSEFKIYGILNHGNKSEDYVLILTTDNENKFKKSVASIKEGLIYENNYINIVPRKEVKQNE